jgi:hypothetical protein
MNAKQRATIASFLGPPNKGPAIPTKPVVLICLVLVCDSNSEIVKQQAEQPSVRKSIIYPGFNRIPQCLLAVKVVLVRTLVMKTVDCQVPRVEAFLQPVAPVVLPLLQA